LVGDVDWGWVALVLAVLVPSVMLHEIAHGWVAERFGDDTARRAGRLTLNPLAHVDPVGTVILPLVLSLSGAGVFGWAKPVPVSPRRLRNPRSHSLWVGLAGPGTNVVIAVAAALLYRSHGQEWLFWLGAINVILAVFNLLPIPPLDGSAVVERVLPLRWWPAWLRIRQWGMGVVLLLVLVVPGALTRVFDPALELWARLL
jgi:Zn-dependent protease